VIIIKKMSVFTLFHKERYVLTCQCPSIECYDCAFVSIDLTTLILQSGLSFYRFLEDFKIYLRNDLIASVHLCVSNRKTIDVYCLTISACTLLCYIAYVSPHNRNKCNFLTLFRIIVCFSNCLN